jgi:hypothetical protein
LRARATTTNNDGVSLANQKRSDVGQITTRAATTASRQIAAARLVAAPAAATGYD